MRYEQVEQIGTTLPCAECGAEAGTRHSEGCLLEVCPCCGGRLLLCELHDDCSYSGSTLPTAREDHVPWNGVLPYRGVFDSYCRYVETTHENSTFLAFMQMRYPDLMPEQSVSRS